MSKKSIGRQKIPIEKIKNENHLQVTFSKRKAGLFKKASELSTLCGAEIGLVVFSPANKVYTFGHPDIKSVVDKYHSHSPPLLETQTNQIIQSHRNAKVCTMNQELSLLENHIEIEKKRGKELEKVVEADHGKYWWSAPISSLGLVELEKLQAAMFELNSNVQACNEHIRTQSGIVLSNTPAATDESFSNPPTATSTIPFYIQYKIPSIVASQDVVSFNSNNSVFGNF